MSFGLLSMLLPASDCIQAGEQPQRRTCNLVAVFDVNQVDHPHRLQRLFKTIEERAQFSTGGEVTQSVREQAEHVLNWLQASSGLDGNDSGTPEQMYAGDSGDSGWVDDGVGDRLRLFFDQVVDCAVLE